MSSIATVPSLNEEACLADEDPLLDCLLTLARLYDLPASREALCAGLPFSSLLTPSLFMRAARRIGLACRLCKRALTELDETQLPTVILLKNNRATLLYRLDIERGMAYIGAKHLTEAQAQLPLQSLRADYAGFFILVRPRFQFNPHIAHLDALREGHWFWNTVKQSATLYRDALIAAFLINACALVVPLVTMNIYDRVVPNLAVETLWVLALGALLVVFFDFLLKWCRSYLIDLAGRRVDIALSSLIMERVLGIQLEVCPTPIGAFAANLRAFETVRDFIASASIVSLIDLSFVFLFLAVMMWLSPWFTLPVVLGATVMLLQAWLLQKKMCTLSETGLHAHAQRNALLIESLGALETLKALTAQGQQQRRWEQKTLFLTQLGSQLKSLASFTQHFAGCIQQWVYIATLVLGVYLIMAAETSQGGVIAAVMLSTRAIAPLSQLVSLLTQYHHAKASLSSVEQLMNLPLECSSDTPCFSCASFNGAIAFNEVSFHYPASNVNALSQVSFSIASGERVGIIGAVGSGKSTVQKLLLGLYRPVSGTILFDGIDARQIDLTKRRQQIGYLPQDTVLLYGSLRQNLLLAAPWASEEELNLAMNMAGLTAWLNTHPQGFAMQVGERGEALSGGQRTAIGLARVFLSQAPILLLDEPLNHMDARLAAHTKQTLALLPRSKTLMVVTHQMELLEVVDRLIVFDRGRLIADGPKNKVLAEIRAPRNRGQKLDDQRQKVQ